MTKTKQETLLEKYGNAQTDYALLGVLLQAMSSSNDSPPGVDATIVRSMDRASSEMHQIKTEYEAPE